MALATVSAVVLVSAVWRLYFGPQIPDWVIWEDSAFADAAGQYEIELRHKTVRVRCGIENEGAKTDTRVIWTSPEEVRVQKALSCDVDNDSTDELVLLCWKKGRYGEHRPFWVEEDEDTWSQHLFVYEYNDGRISPKWMSSHLGKDAADIASNGKDAPDIRLWFRAPDDEMSCWKDRKSVV